MSTRSRLPLASTLFRLFHAAEGNIAILFSLALMVMLGGAGAAIDYVRLNDEKTIYAAAADAAVLAAVATAREAEKNGEQNIPQLARDAALQAWNANISGADFVSKNGPDITITHEGIAWTAKVSFDELSPTSLIALLGVDNMRLAGEASASTKVEKFISYWDFHILIDTSSSMGIGATAADMAALEAHPQINCAFACHSADYSNGDTDSAKIAQKEGIKLRIDVVDEAVDSMIDDLKKASTDDNIRSQLWGLNDSADNLVDLTKNLNEVKNHKIELYKTPVSVGNTNYEAALAKITSEVGEAGDGKSAVSPKKAVFIVTDGIHDTNVNTSNVSYVWWSDHQMGTVDPAFCQSMKDDGVLVGVLFIDYISPAQYADVMSNVTPSVLPSLESCASEGLFFNATSPEGITSAMKEMLATAFGMGAVRLTN